MAYRSDERGAIRTPFAHANRTLLLIAAVLLAVLVWGATTVRAELTFTNADCWGCHGQNYDHFTPEKGNDYINCDLCHAGLDSQYGTNGFLDAAPSDHPGMGSRDNCTWCHNSSWPNVPQHTEANLGPAHETTTPFASCESCHSSSLIDEHPDCATCHASTAAQYVKDAIAAGDTSCEACHLDIDAAHIAIHDGALLDPSCLTCHASNASTEHDNDCALCHESPDPGVIQAIDEGQLSCEGTCHQNPDAAHIALHDDALLDPSCLSCHASNASTEHANNCALCHESPDPGVIQAIDEGQLGCEGTCHQNVDAAHIALHDDALLDPSCLSCHESNASTEHADNCALCHDSTEPGVIQAIDEGVLSCEGTCHPVFHTGLHTSSIAGTRCESCHAVDLTFEPGHVDCETCHLSSDPLVVAAIDDWDGSCTSCHPDYHGSPHGGYNMNTDMCLQCHDIHEAAGDYVLMRQQTVTEVCATCHTLYQSAPTGAYDPGFPGSEAREMPDIAAYKVEIGSSATHGGHRLGMGSDEIPGGSQALTAIQYLGYPGTVSATEFTATDGLYCASCHTPHGEFGNMMPMSFNTALLSSKPNHIQEDLSGVLDDWVTDGGKWCGACHDRRLPGADVHNHPDTGCLVCHGDSITEPTEDFPHTSNDQSLLTLNPDELCLQCHVVGLLP